MKSGVERQKHIDLLSSFNTARKLIPGMNGALCSAGCMCVCVQTTPAIIPRVFTASCTCAEFQACTWQTPEALGLKDPSEL